MIFLVKNNVFEELVISGSVFRRLLVGKKDENTYLIEKIFLKKVLIEIKSIHLQSVRNSGLFYDSIVSVAS
jgi:hypothetical protein